MSAERRAGLGAEESQLPHFRSCPEDPEVPVGQVGIWITAGTPRRVGGRALWALHGRFCVPSAVAGSQPQRVLERIVVVLMQGSTHDVQARHAFRDELVFPEDVTLEGELVGGAFHLDLLRLFHLVAPYDTYFVVASVGEYLSDTLRREAHMPWLQAPANQDVASERQGGVEDDEVNGEEETEDEDAGWMIND